MTSLVQRFRLYWSVVTVTVFTILVLHLTNLQMSNYAKVERKLWRKRCWDSDTKTLAAYFLSGPHGQAEGYYYLPKAYICDDLGWSLERLAEPFAVLLANGFIKYDEDACVILITNALRYNPPDNRNQAIAAVNKIVEVPESPLLSDFQQLAERYSERLAERLRERYGKGYGNPPTPTPTPTPTPEGVPTEAEEATKDKEESEGEESIPPSSPRYGENHPAFKVALHLRRRLLQWMPTLKPIPADESPAAMESWATEIDRAIRLDKRDPDRLIEMVDWLHDEEQPSDDNFRWRDNILSAAKLREKYSKVEINKAKSQKTAGGARRHKRGHQKRPRDFDKPWKPGQEVEPC